MNWKGAFSAISAENHEEVYAEKAYPGKVLAGWKQENREDWRRRREKRGFEGLKLEITEENSGDQRERVIVETEEIVFFRER